MNSPLTAGNSIAWYTNLRMSPPEMIVIAEGQHFFLKLKTQLVRNSVHSTREMCNATSPHFVPCRTAVQLGKTRTVQTLKYVVVTANSRILIGSFEFDHQVNNISLGGKVIVGNSKLFLKQVQVCKDLTMLVFRRSKMLVYHRYRLPGCTARLLQKYFATTKLLHFFTVKQKIKTKQPSRTNLN